MSCYLRQARLGGTAKQEAPTQSSLGPGQRKELKEQKGTVQPQHRLLPASKNTVYLWASNQVFTNCFFLPPPYPDKLTYTYSQQKNISQNRKLVKGILVVSWTDVGARSCIIGEHML